MKNKVYKVKPNRNQLKIIKEYWELFCEVYDEFYSKIRNLEEEMEMKTNIKGIEFFCSDGEWCGVGNADRTMALIQLDLIWTQFKNEKNTKTM